MNAITQLAAEPNVQADRIREWIDDAFEFGKDSRNDPHIRIGYLLRTLRNVRKALEQLREREAR